MLYTNVIRLIKQGLISAVKINGVKFEVFSKNQDLIIDRIKVASSVEVIS